MYNRIICSVLGAAFIAMGIAIIVSLNYGMPSFDTFILTLSNVISMSYTNTLRLVQLIILITLMLLKRYYSLTWTELFVSALSVATVTILIDVAMTIIAMFLTKNYIWLGVGFIFYAYGITLLVQSDIFLSPNDKILTAISHRTGRSYALYKVISDILMLVISLAVIKLQGYDISVSLVSVFLTFFTGTFVGLFLKMNKAIF